MRAAATPRHRRGAEVQTGPICISHGDKMAEKKTLDEEEDDAAEEEFV
jgi:hypothetical protein